jgi:TfoX/Sxy family transcriptional regulator of competence genes
MPYNSWLAERLRTHFANRRDVVEKKMFGGLGFLLAGNMCVCVWQDSLILRLGEEGASEALKQPGVRPFDVTGKPMRGWAMIDAADLEERGDLGAWVEKCVAFASALPPKAMTAKKPAKKPAKERANKPPKRAAPAQRPNKR